VRILFTGVRTNRSTAVAIDPLGGFFYKPGREQTGYPPVFALAWLVFSLLFSTCHILLTYPFPLALKITPLRFKRRSVDAANSAVIGFRAMRTHRAEPDDCTGNGWQVEKRMNKTSADWAIINVAVLVPRSAWAL
jgi:hypothetical protein